MLPPLVHLIDRTTVGGRAMADAPRVMTVVWCASARTAGMGRTCYFIHGPGRAEAVGQNWPSAILIPFQFRYLF
jgi:hypothetical protein